MTRASLYEVVDALQAAAGLELQAQYRPRYNVAPTDAHPIVTLKDGNPGDHVPGRALDLATWGFVAPPRPDGRTPLVINARSETAAFRPMFRDAFVRRRCLVVADGFYEWRQGGGKRQPMWFHRADGGLLTFAGLFDDGPADGQRRFVVLTTAPNGIVAPVHDRMPAIVEGAAANRWLQICDADLLQPAREDLLVARPVSARVNAVKNDDPACLAASECGPEPVESQLRLFPG